MKRIIKRFIIVIIIVLFYVSCAKQELKPFYFIQMCDTQLGMGGYEQDILAFKQAVKQINALNPDFVVICGDLVDDPNDSSYYDFKKVKESFTMPCYVAPGNHDVGNIPNNTTLSYYRNTIGKDYYTFRNKGYIFIVTNTQLWKVNIVGESERQDNWFKKTLTVQDDENSSIFVIGHYPLYTKNPTEVEDYFNLPLIKRNEILELLMQNSVLAYLSGHTHELVINNYKNTQMVSGETTSLNFDDRPLGFRLWKVSSGTVKYQFIPLQIQIVKQINPKYN